MVVFCNEQNQNIVLSTVNYQFPDSNDKEYDGNWLQIKIEVSDTNHKWENTDPFLLSYDWLEISNWFNDLSQFHQSRRKDLVFIEPNIEFQLVNFSKQNNQIEFNIQLNLECIPTFLKGKDDVKYHFVFTSEKCKEISTLCEKEYERFPERK